MLVTIGPTKRSLSMRRFKMTKMNEVYRCNVCGNIVEVVHTGAGQLVCCGQPMELLVERTEEDQYKEKHVPVVSKTDAGLKVAVGSVTHPMEEKHFIEWIEVMSDGRVCRKALKPGAAPEAEFAGALKPTAVRAYCNIHGLWIGKVE
jgi:superoxide reductase